MKLIVNNNLIDLSHVAVIKENDETSTSFHYGEEEGSFVCLNLPIKNILSRLNSLGVKVLKDEVNEEYIVEDNIIAIEDQGDGDYFICFKNGTTGNYNLKEDLKKLYPSVENIENEILEELDNEESEKPEAPQVYASGDSLDRDPKSTIPKIIITLAVVIGAILVYKFLK